MATCSAQSNLAAKWHPVQPAVQDTWSCGSSAPNSWSSTAFRTSASPEPVRELTAIAGQKPIVINAKRSVATFKLREGMPIGVKVTLRGIRMYEFLDRLVNIALPRVRDFRGLSPNSFDGRGNYALGIKEQIVFEEIDGVWWFVSQRASLFCLWV